MSPRSEEFIDQARDRLAMVREVLVAGHREGGDHSAVTPSADDAERYVQGAAEFLAAVEAMVGSNVDR